jgi:endonuclease III related protein
MPSAAYPKGHACQAPFLDLTFYDRYRALEMSASRFQPQFVHSPCFPPTPVAGQVAPPAEPARRGTVSRDASLLRSYYGALFAAHGPQHWWPGRSRFEIIVGAILTQNTGWKNVQRAISNLRKARLLTPRAIAKVRASTLAVHLRPSGYFRQKTKTLKAFVDFLFSQHCGSLDHLFATPTAALREQLLALRGIGPETADSILLYAGKHPVFVVDAYSRRILERHGLAHPRSSYEELRSAFESSLPRDHQLFNEFHALIVHTGKEFCRKSSPACSRCALKPFLPEQALGQSPVSAREPDSPR